MASKKTWEKRKEINQLLNEGKMNNRQIAKEVEVSLRDVHKWVIPKDTIPTVSEGIKSVSRKRSFDLGIATEMKVMHLSYLTQYGKIAEDGSFKHLVRMQKFQEVEEYLTKRTGITFNYVITKRLEEALKRANKDIMKLNGGK